MNNRSIKFLNLLAITLGLFIQLNGQVRTITTKFDPVYEFPDSGLFIVDGSFLGKTLLVSDANDNFNNEITILTPSQDSVATYNESVNKFTVGSILTFKFVNISDTVYLQSDGGVNNRIGNPGYPITTDLTVAFVYTSNGWIEKIPSSEKETIVDTYSEIGLRAFNVGDRVIVLENNDFAVHIIKADSIAGFSNGNRGVIETGNSLYAHLQPVNGRIFATHMGAVNDGVTINDSYFQRAFDYCAISEISGYIFAPEGEYKFDNGFILGEENDGFNTISIGGVSSSYTDKSTTIFSTDSTNSFIIGVVGGRNPVIENIYFKGPSFTWDSKDVAYQTVSWSGFFRDNIYSAFSAIVIDPFAASVSASDRYPEYSSIYPVTNRTSSVTIRNVGIRYFHTAINVDPAGGNQNGDNIKLENSRVEYVRRVWATKSSQARANSIENCYITFCESIIYNHGIGDAPRVLETNAAGFIYELAYIKGGFARAIFNNCQLESVFSFGTYECFEGSFNNCLIKLQQTYPSRHGMILGTTPIEFNNTELLNFNNCNTIKGFNHSTRLTFNSCTIEGITFINGNDQDGSRQGKKEIFHNTYFKCYDSFVDDGGRSFQHSTDPVSGKIIGKSHIYEINGGEYECSEYDNMFYKQVESGIDIKRYSIDANQYGYYFTVASPEKYALDQVLHTRENLNGLFQVVGTVSSISNDTIYTKWPTLGTFDTTSVFIWNRRYKKFFSPILVEIKDNSDTVRVLDYAGQEDYVNVGDVMQSLTQYFTEAMIPQIKVKTSTYWVMEDTLDNVSGTDTVFAFDGSFTTLRVSRATNGAYIPNGFITETGTSYVLVCNRTGIIGSDVEPLFDTLFFGIPDLSDITTDTIVISTTKSATVDYNVGNDFIANSMLQEINLWMSCPSGAGSDTQLLLPSTSSFYLGKKIRIIAVDDNVTYDVQISAATNQLWQGGSVGTSLTLSDGDTYTIICMEDSDSPGNYLWVIHN